MPQWQGLRSKLGVWRVTHVSYRFRNLIESCFVEKLHWCIILHTLSTFNDRLILVFEFMAQGNIASAISTIQASKISEDGTQGVQGLMIR